MFNLNFYFQRISEISWINTLAFFFYFTEFLANFLIGEAHLEIYLEETSPTESNFAKARTGLQDAKKYLNLVTGENGQKAGIALDAYLLLAKLCYACGEYEKSLQNFVKAELNTLAEKELTLLVKNSYIITVQ